MSDSGVEKPNEYSQIDDLYKKILNLEKALIEEEEKHNNLKKAIDDIYNNVFQEKISPTRL